MKNRRKKKLKEIKVYDKNDTTHYIDKNKRLSIKDLGFKLPPESPTKVISIRLPTELYNIIKAFSTNNDIPYQAYIKYLLARGIKKDVGSKLEYNTKDRK